ncbi:MAG: hypothetical protein A4E19_02030 [Nitrospira sp. SG-bin1]|nr:MAG: hypothetical protein A4E19_02030 [Nitrospira sp. SG-bin1]
MPRRYAPTKSGLKKITKKFLATYLALIIELAYLSLRRGVKKLSREEFANAIAVMVSAQLHGCRRPRLSP